MIGAIAGDINGSVYEKHPIKSKAFPLFHSRCRFTDDTVLTVAVAEAILSEVPYQKAVHEFGRRYPQIGYGGSFTRWLSAENPPGPYNSWGNGSAMRVSPVGYAFNSLEEVLQEAAASAAITHNHPEGIRGAQATALAICLAKHGEGKSDIRHTIEDTLGYDLNHTVDEIRPDYGFNVSCQGTVPQAIIAFLDSISYEDAIRNAISLGGDSDTLACITGSMAEAFYKEIPTYILQEVKARLDTYLWDNTLRFYRRYGLQSILEQLHSLDVE